MREWLLRQFTICLLYTSPLNEASEIAVNTILDFLSKDDTIEEVKIVCFDKRTYDYYVKSLEKFGDKI